MSAYPNRDKVSSGLDLLREALAPYVCAQLEAHFKADWWTRGVYYTSCRPSIGPSCPNRAAERTSPKVWTWLGC